MRKMIRKPILLLLCILLIGTALPAGAETAPVPQRAAGIDYTLRLQLNPEAFSPESRLRLHGIRDLLAALEFQGTVCYDPSIRYLDLSLYLRPLDRSSQPITVRISGYPAALYISSNLLGEEKMLISGASLLDFAVKTYYRLGLKLHYPALLYPYVYEFAAFKIIKKWNNIFTPSDDSKTVLSAKSIASLAKTISNQLNQSSDLSTLITALGLVGGQEEAVTALFEDLPHYLTRTLTGGQSVVIRRSADEENWSARKKPFFTRISRPELQSVRLELPAFANGYLPSFSWSLSREEGGNRLELNAGVTHPSREDLFTLSVSGDRLPAVWPAEASGSGSFSLSGALVPQGAFRFGLTTEASGSFQLEIKKPSGEEAEGNWMLRAEGSATPRDMEVTPGQEKTSGHVTDILRVNDTTLAEFVRRVRLPAAAGMLRFIAGIPTAACQALMDDLTESGILHILLPSD